MPDFTIAALAAFVRALCIGMLLGGLYFSALWLTLRRLPGSRWPALIITLSLSARLGMLLACFFWIVRDGHWEQLLTALVGFLAVRILLTHGLNPTAEIRLAQLPKETPP